MVLKDILKSYNRSVEMKSRSKLDSKIPTTKTNTNRKRDPEPGETGNLIESSLFKKNEFALILFGALLLTLIVFFIFFRSPGDTPSQDSDKTILSGEQTTQKESVPDLEKRIQALEQAFLKTDQGTENNGASPKNSGTLDLVKERVTRLETAFGVKFNSLIERMGMIEKKLEALNKANDNSNNMVSEKSNASSVVKSPEKASVPVKTATKKVAENQTKAAMFHTIQKGETLYSIGKKYNISVSDLQKLNKLTSKTTLYPGMNILIR